MGGALINDYSREEVTVLSSTEVADGVKEIVFRKPTKDYLPGQFIGIEIEDNQLESGFRSYSILDGKEKNTLVIYVKKVEGGRGSTYLHSLSKGDTMNILYPLGYFGFQKNLPKHLVFIATGTGIVPILSLLEHVPQHFVGSCTLYFGVRSENDIFCLERIKNLMINNSYFNYILTLSRPTEGWAGEKGRVTEILKKEVIPTDAQFYICGAGQMISDVKDILRGNGVLSSQIFYEDFNE